MCVIYIYIYIIFFLPIGAIKHKFGDAQMNKKWPQIRLSLNQKCLDSKRKFLIVEGDVNKSTD